MALITKPDFTYVWASGGAVVAPNDTKKQLGWVAEAPPFQYDNWLQNRQDQMLAHINQRGIAAWDALTNYEAGGLSYVQGSDGKIYKSVAASGPSATVQNPTTDGTDTYWTEAFASIGAFITQTAGDVRYTQRSNNLSDVANASTAFSNIKQPASETATGVVELATTVEAQLGASSSLVVTPANLNSTVIGMGQTLQNLLASRAVNTTYTNSTGRTIFVLSSINVASGANVLLQLDGVSIGNFSNNGTGATTIYCAFLVKDGMTYRLQGGTSAAYWGELR